MTHSSFASAARRVALALTAGSALVASRVAAQDVRPSAVVPSNAPIDADRAHVTESAATVGSGVFQIEGGYTSTNSGGERMQSIGQGLVRAGLMYGAEVRLYTNSFDVISSPAGRASGYESMAAGLKLRLTDGTAGTLRPALALEAMTSLPGGSRMFGTRSYDPTARAIASWAFTPRIGVATNLVYASERVGDERYGEWTYAGSVRYAFAPALQMFGEYYYERSGGYGDAADVDRVRGVHGGMAWTMGRDFQLDASVGHETGTAPTATYLRAGFARRW